MDKQERARAKRWFLIAFAVLTSLCWCPWAYGHLTGRVLAIPTWAVIAYVCAAALFALEWVFLFASGLAVTDEQLPHVVADLEAVGSDNSAPSKEGS